MFDIGFGEMILLAAIALIAIGPKQLPEVARVIGRMLNEFKRATGDLTRSIAEARDNTNQMLSDTHNSINKSMNEPPVPTQGAEVATPKEPSDDQQMAFLMPDASSSTATTQAPASEPSHVSSHAPTSAPVADPTKKES